MYDGSLFTKSLEVVRLLTSAAGCSVAFGIWTVCRQRPKASRLLDALADLFGGLSVVLFFATAANLWRVAYGSAFFNENPVTHISLLVLYASQVGLAARFLRRLKRG